MGLEPTTTGITIRGSTNWATPTIVNKTKLQHIFGTPGRIRTCYPRLSLPTTAFAAVPIISLSGTFVVWTISSPFQVPHVWPLRNPTKISCKIYIVILIILRRFYPQGYRFIMVIWIQIITLICFRTIDTIKTYIFFINCLHMSAVFVSPTRPEMHC